MISLKERLNKLSCLPKPLLILGAAVVGILILTLFSSLLPSPKTQVVKTTPNNEEQNVSLALSQISISFSRALKSIDEVSINPLPIISYSSQLSDDKKTLILALSQKLVEDTLYTLEIENKEKKPLYSWSFQTIKLETKGFGNPNISQEIEAKDKKEYPLLHYVPFENDLFAIDYLAPQHLEVRIKTASVSATKAAVEQWIKQKGVNPETHQITFISQ